MGKRVGMLDEVRGITYILMIIYHLYYDLAFVYALAMPDMVHVIFRIVQPLSNIFLFVAGASSVYSSNNFKRGTKYFFLAMLLTFVTAIAMPSEAIVFGVLHFLGIAAMIYGFIGKFTESIPSAVGVILFSLLFVMTYNLPRGYLGIEGIFSVPLPDQLYSHFWLFPLGFSTSGFVSSDYFPLLPYLFIFMVVVIIVYGWMLHSTVFGRGIYTIGGNRECARLAGVNIDRTQLVLFINSAMISVLAGVVWVAYKRMSSAGNIIGSGANYDALTAAILGGVAFAGGSGGMAGAFAAVVMVCVFYNGLTILGLPTYLSVPMQGLLLIIALILDYLVTGRGRKFRIKIKRN